MTTRTNLFTRVAVVAILALVLGLLAGGGLATTAEATESPGQSNHCPLNSIQVRFEGAGTHDGFTVVEGDGYTWTWTYAGTQEIDSIWVFGGNTLKKVPGPYGTSGTIDAEELDLVNPGGNIADISHVDFCLVPPTSPRTFKVMPQKVWDFGEADVPANGKAQITIDAGIHGSATWAFDSEGVLIEGDGPMVLPKGATYEVTEVLTAPEGFTCELDEIAVREQGYRRPHRHKDVIVTVRNVCTEDEEPPVTIPPVTIPPVTVPPEPATTTTTAEVAGEVVEATTTTTAEVAGEVVEALPRTGGGSAALALVAVASLALGGGLVAAARRRQLQG